MNVSVVFLFLLTSYSLLFLIFHIWLFSALDLPLSFLGQQTEEMGIKEVFKHAETRGMEEIYWCWWGHRQGPIGHFFCLVAGVAGWIGVSEAIFLAAIAQTPLFRGFAVHQLMHPFPFCVSFDFTTAFRSTTKKIVRQYYRVWEESTRM
jgi:hypothetical protein